MSLNRIISTINFPQLSYSIHGAGPAIVLLHGFPLSGNIWDELITELSETNTLVIPDIPGTGESKLGLFNTTIELLAEIVPALLDDAGIATCILAGHSMGGYIALAVAELYPERITGLVLIHSTALADSEEKKQKRQKIIGLIEKGGKDGFIKAMIPELFNLNLRLQNPFLINSLIEKALSVPAITLITYYQAMILRPDRVEVLKNAPFPVMFILGKEDTTIPYETCLQQTSIPSVSFVELFSNCAHMSMMEQVKKLNSCLQDFTNYCIM